MSHLFHRTRAGYNPKNAFNHTFEYHLSYDRKHLITVKTAGTDLLTKGRDPCLEYEITDLLRSTHRQLNSLGFPRANSPYITTPVLLLLLNIHIKEGFCERKARHRKHDIHLTCDSIHLLLKVRVVAHDPTSRRKEYVGVQVEAQHEVMNLVTR